MNIIRTAFGLLSLIMATGLTGQTIAGYSFDSYKTEKISTSKKAKINYESDKIAKLYRTAITEGYNLGDVNFAGHYVVCTWGCGLGCSDGAMVDGRNGNVYKLPMGETKYYFGCTFEDDEGCVDFLKDSRLFITQICVQTQNNTETDIQEQEHFINIWDEAKKKFEFIKSVKIQKIVPAD